MNDDSELKHEILCDLMNKMREMDASRFKPKAVEVDVSTLHPADEMHGAEVEAEPSSIMHGETGEMGHGEPDGDEISPEDRAVLEKLFSSDDDHDHEVG